MAFRPRSFKTADSSDFRAATRKFAKDIREVAAVMMNETIDAEVALVEAQSTTISKPLKNFRGVSGGFRPTVMPNMLKAVTIDFDHRPEIIDLAFSTLFVPQNIPVETGDYRDAFKLFINGQPGIVSQLKFGMRAVIVNEAPYARMLEVGLRPDGTPFVLKTAPHIVERIATTLMKRKWGRVAYIKFGYFDIPDPYILVHDAPDRRGKIKPGKGAGDPIRYPAIILE